MTHSSPTRRSSDLAPPPGGERRLREALRDRDRNTRTIGWKLPLAGACASLCVLVLAHALQPDRLDAEVRRAVNPAAAPIQGIRVAGARAEPIASHDANVHLYRPIDTQRKQKRFPPPAGRTGPTSSGLPALCDRQPLTARPQQPPPRPPR